MIEPVKKLADPAVTSQEPIWQRQEGESSLWYNRFRIYRNLGYKRSLVAALVKEQETVKVLKGPKISKKPGVPKVSNALVEVPKPALVQVPGSWKRASITWHWMERAAAWDEYRIDQMVEGAIDDLLDGAGVSFNRVMLLKSLLENLRAKLNAQSTDMTFEQYCMWIQRMQSVMKQISDEMQLNDEAIQRAVMRHLSIKVYQEYDPAKSDEVK